MKKTTRKLLSLLLALAMILTLAPIAVFAEDEPAPADPVVVEEPAEPVEEPAEVEPETGSVVAVIWSKGTVELLDSLADSTGKKLFATMSRLGIEDYARNLEPSWLNKNATGVPVLKDLQNASQTDELPDFTLVLLNEEGKEVGTFVADTEAKGSDIVIETITDGAMDDSSEALNKIHSSRYKVFRVDGIPAGTYTLGIKGIPEPYGLVDGTLDIGFFDVVVNETTMIGKTKEISGFTEKDHGSGWSSDWKTTNKTLSFIGISPEFRKETMGFKFRTTDVVGEPVQGAEFVMVNRDELLGLLEPVVGVGKAVFSKAIENLGNPEVFSFEELVALHTNLLKQNEQGYIALDMESVYGIVQAYLGLLSGVGPEVLAQFVNYDENGGFAGLKHPLPAVLSAKSDENGVVTFTESSNVTLTWLIQILLDFGVGTLNNLAGNNALLGFMTPLLQMIQLVMDPDSVDVESLNSQSFLDLVKNIPGIESNEWVKNAIDAAGGFFGGLVDAILTTEIKRSIVNWIHDNLYDPIMNYVYGMLQNFGIVGDKISKGNYLLFEYKTPEAVLDEEGNVVEDYARSPLVYTLNLDWKEPDNVYATVTDLGLIGPYIAPQFYDFVRNTNYEGVVAKYLGKKAWDYDFLSKLMTGRIALAEKSKQQIEGAFTAYMADTLYEALGLDLVFNSRIALMQGMNDYLISQKDANTNLRAYVNAQAKKAKSVYAGSLTSLSEDVADEELWTFYTLDASPTLTATKLIDKSTKDIAAAYPDGSERQAGILQNGGTVSKIVNRIGTSIENTVKSVVTRVQEAFGDVIKNITNSITTGIKNLVSGIFSNIFGGGASEAETPADANA